jgi:hypothetical protein
VYCRECNRSSNATNVFYKAASADEAAKCEPCGNMVGRAVLMMIGVVAGSVFALMMVLVALRRLSSETVARLQHILIRYTPSNKLKIVVVFYQIATRVPSVYEVSLPANIADVLDHFSTIVTLGLDNVAMAPLECMQLHGYVPRLLFWMVLPIVLTLAVVVFVILASGWRRLMCGELLRIHILPQRWSRRSSSRDSWRRSGSQRESVSDHGASLLFHLQRDDEKQRQQYILERALQVVLLIMFLLYPKVTNVAFEGFPCCARSGDSNV